MSLPRFQRVRVRTLGGRERHDDGSEAVMRIPAVGDTGMIVEALPSPDGDGICVVECGTPEGLTVRLAGFHADEIALA